MTPRVRRGPNQLSLLKLLRWIKIVYAGSNQGTTSLSGLWLGRRGLCRIIGPRPEFQGKYHIHAELERECSRQDSLCFRDTLIWWTWDNTATRRGMHYGTNMRRTSNKAVREAWLPSWFCVVHGRVAPLGCPDRRARQAVLRNASLLPGHSSDK
jgi:hypothetical protein